MSSKHIKKQKTLLKDIADVGPIFDEDIYNRLFETVIAFDNLSEKYIFNGCLALLRNPSTNINMKMEPFIRGNIFYKKNTNKFRSALNDDLSHSTILNIAKLSLCLSIKRGIPFIQILLDKNLLSLEFRCQLIETAIRERNLYIINKLTIYESVKIYSDDSDDDDSV